MAPRQTPTLRALLIFINSMYKEMFRAVCVFRLADGGEETEEREYLLGGGRRKDEKFGGSGASRALTLYGFDVSDQHAGLNNGVWKCVYVFDSRRSRPPLVDFCDEWVPISKNSREIFEDLDDELNAISELAQNEETEKSEQNIHTEVCSSKVLTKQRLGMKSNIRFFDLNSFPDSDDEDNKGISVHKKRRAAPEDISRIALQDLVKYFDLPITEASKGLKIGLTVLKKKCREFGIPRWPHRKIKSLDRLIVNLQEEMQQQNDDEDTTMEVSTKKKMIEFERERIEKKPPMDIQEETKKFRQGVFKRRHKARAMERTNPNLSLSLETSENTSSVPKMLSHSHESLSRRCHIVQQ